MFSLASYFIHNLDLSNVPYSSATDLETLAVLYWSLLSTTEPSAWQMSGALLGDWIMNYTQFRKNPVRAVIYLAFCLFVCSEIVLFLLPRQKWHNLGSLQPSPPRFKWFSCLSISASWVAGTTHVCHQAQLIFVFLVEAGFHHVGQDGLNFLTSWSTCLGLPKCQDYRHEPLHLAVYYLYIIILAVYVILLPLHRGHVYLYLPENAKSFPENSFCIIL